MRIEFERVIIDNFMSIGHVDLQFNNEGFIRVSGINQSAEDNSNSNGSGKSSLWEAVVWAITGDTIRGTKQVSNIYTKDGAVVELRFSVDNNSYQIIRSKDHSVRKTNLVIFINGQDVSGKGIRDSDKILKQYLPDLTASLLGSVIILGQGLPQRFTNNTPSGRKEVLEALSRSDFMIEDLKQRVSNRKSELTTQHKSYCDSILQDQAQQKLLQDQIDNSNKTIDQLSKNNDETLLAEKREEASSLEKQIQSTSMLIDEKTTELTVKTQHMYQLTEQEHLELTSYDEAHLQETQPYKNKIAELNASLKISKRSLEDMQNIRDICPTCGQKITGVHKPDTTALEAEVITLTNELKQTTDCLNNVEFKYVDLSQKIKAKYFEEKQTQKQTVDFMSCELSQIKNSLQTLTTRYNSVVKFIEDTTRSYSQRSATLELHNKIIIENNEKLKLLQDQIMYNIMQRDLTQSHLEVISKFDTSLKRDFRGYLLSTVIEYIEQRAKYYSEQIFNNSNVSFVLDGNNIDIRYANKCYENLSGGEKQKIDLIVQFSIRDMLSAQLGFTSNILVLDEVFDGLDALGCNKVIDMIASVPDVKNIFIVTHRKDLSIPTDKELIVVKTSAGISEIGT